MIRTDPEVVTALGSEDRLDKEIQDILPGIRQVDIEARNTTSPSPRFISHATMYTSQPKSKDERPTKLLFSLLYICR